MRRPPRIVLTYPIHARAISEELSPHARVTIARTRAELLRSLRDADALITRVFDRVDEKLLDLAPKLRAVGNYGVGVDNIDLRACARRGVRVANTPDVLTRATAELTVALLFAAARRFPEGEALCRSGRFRGWQPDLLLGQELQGRRAVLVGKGRIGRETGRLFRALGLKVEWITRKDTPGMVQKKLKRAQVLSLHIPLTSETLGWLDESRLALLPPEAIVLNTTRGPVVDESALVRVLKERKIFAAGLDVFEKEPEIPLALRRLPNVVLSPHLGSATAEAREAMARLVISGVLSILGGKRPWNEVNPNETSC
ncbi:MAG: D-glycerate dehydrogenase [Oligoflexia bacterium]|nr:D-glycerate dehydrogenase [Oligoflexia bacterium]